MLSLAPLFHYKLYCLHVRCSTFALVHLTVFSKYKFKTLSWDAKHIEHLIKSLPVSKFNCIFFDTTVMSIVEWKLLMDCDLLSAIQDYVLKMGFDWHHNHEFISNIMKNRFNEGGRGVLNTSETSVFGKVHRNIKTWGW